MEIQGYENYLIYDDGRVWGKKRKIFLKPNKIKKGYLQVSLSKNNKCNGFLIHRLIAIHYIPNPNNKPEVDHINSITNDNRIENLQWVTSQENNDKRNVISNTGEKYIYKVYRKNRNKYYYQIERKNCFLKHIYCSKYTLQDAIKIRDELLMENNVV